MAWLAALAQTGDRRAFAFILDTRTLPVSIERLTDERVVHQVSTALGGRRVQVVNHRGMAWIIAMDVPPIEEFALRRRRPGRPGLLPPDRDPDLAGARRGERAGSSDP